MSEIRTIGPDEVWALLAELAASQRKTELRQQEAARQIKELGKQIGGLGNKLGSFTEGLALPSMEKILRERFGMEVVAPSVRAAKDDEHLEIDVLSYANGAVNTVCLVEVKSHLREEAITQILAILNRFEHFFPEHRGKKLYGILAAVGIPESLKARVLAEGLYLARIHDDVFDLEVPKDFQPRSFGSA